MKQLQYPQQGQAAVNPVDSTINRLPCIPWVEGVELWEQVHNWLRGPDSPWMQDGRLVVPCLEQVTHDTVAAGFLVMTSQIQESTRKRREEWEAKQAAKKQAQQAT